jgi:hypothetical protein
MVLLINYALQNQFKDYRPLFEAIKNCGPWWHFMDTTWIVNTVRTPDTVSRHLQSFIDTDSDYLLVIRLQKNYQGWLPKDAWDWLNNKQF